MILLYDSCSLGYDYRDFEIVLDFINSRVGQQFLIYTDERNIEIFKDSIDVNRTRFKGYSKSSFSKEELSRLKEENLIHATFSFSDLYEKVKNKARLPSGYLKPSHKSYLSSPSNLVQNYRDILDKLASRHDSYSVIFSIVSGLKPLSDIGQTPSEQKLEGDRQTYPFEEIASVLKFLQEKLIKQQIVVMAITAQYGNSEEIKQIVDCISKNEHLKFPIETIEEIDWSNRPEQQAAFFKAIHERACGLGLPSVAFGNASTYQHLIIAATGGFHLSAVALDSYAKDSRRDGRPYWQELGNGGLTGLRTFRQENYLPGNWKPVTQAMQTYLCEGIYNYTKPLTLPPHH